MICDGGESNWGRWLVIKCGGADGSSRASASTSCVRKSGTPKLSVASGSLAPVLLRTRWRARSIICSRLAVINADNIDGADLDGYSRAAALQALVEAGIGVDEYTPRRRLEDAFLALVGES